MSKLVFLHINLHRKSTKRKADWGFRLSTCLFLFLIFLCPFCFFPLPPFGYSLFLPSSLFFNTFYYSRLWMRSSRVMRVSGCQCQCRNSPGVDPSILRHSRIWGAADKAMLNNVHKKKKSKKSSFILLISSPFFFFQIFSPFCLCSLPFHFF